jgi:hypothetical protein
MAVTPFYAKLTIPAGTTVASPAAQPLSVAPGKIVLARLYVPPGPRGEVSLWLEHNARQFAPVPPGTWDHLDAITLEIPLDYPVPVGEQVITLKATSTNANFEHQVDFEILVDTSFAPLASASPQTLVERVAGLFGL